MFIFLLRSPKNSLTNSKRELQYECQQVIVNGFSTQWMTWRWVAIATDRCASTMTFVRTDGQSPITFKVPHTNNCISASSALWVAIPARVFATVTCCWESRYRFVTQFFRVLRAAHLQLYAPVLGHWSPVVNSAAVLSSPYGRRVGGERSYELRAVCTSFYRRDTRTTTS